MVRGVDTAAAVLPLRKTDENQPDAGRLIFALRQIGYSLEQAIADIVDNSINAEATNVLIRILHDGENISAIAIADDGHGMADPELSDAMRFGSPESEDPNTLGKFGMGMKLASLSHAQKMSVFSRRKGASVGRQWTMEGISTGWWCERIQSNTASDMLDKTWGRLDISGSGTLVIWEDIDRLPSHRSGLRYTLSAIERRLKLHLGLCFHRFIETGKVNLFLDQMIIDRRGQGLQSRIPALNPFGYESSGHPDYPKKMTAELTGIGALECTAHIWPAKSEAEEYRLGRRAASRQGFYFYRNDRLIQTGGWNGLVMDETEPHSSLARVAIDLPTDYDEWFAINVQKSTVQAPPVFAELLSATSREGSTFEDFRRSAIDVYRSANEREESREAYPGHGLPRGVTRQLEKMYAKKSDGKGFDIRWRRLPLEDFFEVSFESAELVLNSRFRESVAYSKVQDNLLKLLVSLLLRRDFRNSPSKARDRELREINSLLVSIVQ
jgi:hypothetical protein